MQVVEDITEELADNNKTYTGIDHVLRGGFITEELNLWKVPSFNLKYFVSSTFTDTHEERNVIMTRLLQELNDIASPHGIDITFVDMRWGVKDENTDDHKTWDACKIELERCNHESHETFFISLQGQKYGYRPLPREIMKSKLDDHVSIYHESDRDELIALAKKWYILDINSIPPKYVLMKLDASNKDEYWNNVLSKLRKLLMGLMFEDQLYIGDSVTNWEAVYALMMNDSTTSNNRVLWMKREIDDAITDVNDPKRDFDDARGNVDVTNRLNNLIFSMTSKLEGVDNGIVTTSIDNVLSIRNKTNNAAFSSYIEEFFNKLKLLLRAEVDHVIQSKESWFSDAFGSGLTGDACIDILHHCSFAREKVIDFKGRDELVNAAMDMIMQPNSTEGIQGSIIGQSGCGKTSFMAKLASLLYESNIGVPVIIRFCGTNDGSSSGLKLLRSIIRQIHFIYSVPNGGTIPEVYSDLVEYFQSLVSTYPVVLFIDSIDQLTNHNQERSNISFLEEIRVHQQGKIVVSCLPDDNVYWYGCEKTLKEWKVPSVLIQSISSDIELILDSYLFKSNRCLLPSQRDVVLNSALQQQDPTALFIKLAARVACSWKSTEQTCVIGNSVPLLINQIFNEVQYNYGQVLIKAVIAFITLAVNGVTSKEMEDLLSLDDEVMHEVNKYNISKRLPSHVWLRVKYELSGLLVESDQGCMKWYHRQLWEVAGNRYSADEKVYYHQIMGRYFSNLVDGDTLTRKSIRKQELLSKIGILPVWFRTSNPYINSRRCTEGGHHLIHGRLYAEVTEELCNLQHVCAYVKSGNGFRLVNNLVSIDQNMRLMSEDEKRVFEEINKRANHYMRWLLKDMNHIMTDVEMNIIATASNEPLVSCVKRDVDELLKERGRVARNGSIQSNESYFDRDSWIRAIRLGGVSNFSPLLMNLLGHSSDVSSVSFSPDGSRIVSGSHDNTVRVWDAVTGEVINTLTGHSDYVTSVSFSPDGSRIVSGSEDKTIRVWDAVTGEVINTLTSHSGFVSSVSFSPDGSQIVSGSGDNTVRVWDAVTGKVINTLTDHNGSVESGSVESVSFSLDGSQIVSGSEDNTVRVWDALTGKVINTLTGHGSNVSSVSFSPDGSRIVSGSEDKTIRVWDAVTGKVINTLKGHSSNVSSVSFSPDGSRIVSGSGDNTVLLWDAVTGKVINTLKGHSGNVNSVSFSPDGSRIVSGSDDKTVQVWDAVTGEVINTLMGHSSDVYSVSFSPDGSQIVSGSRDKTIRVWNTITGEVINTLTGHSGFVSSVSFSPDGSRIVSVNGDNVVRVWDSQTGEVINTLTGHSSSVESVSFSLDGSRIVSGSQDNTVRVWDAVTGKVINTLTGHSGYIRSVSFSPDGSRIVSGSEDKTIRVWDAVTGRVINTLKGHSSSIWSVSFSPDGSRIVSGSQDNTVRVWDAVTGEVINTLKGHSSSVWSVSISPDGSRIVSGSWDNTVRVWDAVTGLVINTLKGHSGSVSSVSFSPDGSQIVSGSQDNTVRVWDAVTGKVINTTTDHSD